MSTPSFGKFSLVTQLGQGGMAEVFKCRLSGIGGFDKLVVVKRILPALASDPEFVRMFLDEARLAANLTHPNIVQVFEIDEVNNQPYMAMEYVDGRTLAQLNRQSRREGKHHLGHMANIVAGVCEGLHYAHTARGPDGGPLGLVHRDVSPQNIMVSREGVPKLLDFGVAKANGRLATTHAGTLKGKLKYMPPEQVRSSDGTLDHRADVYSAGVCLYEVTTGHHPFGGKDISEITLLRNVMQGTYRRPRELQPDYPVDLEEAVLWAIEPDPSRRCPTARDLHDALKRFVASGPHASSDRAVADWMATLSFPVDVPVIAGAQVLTPTRRRDDDDGSIDVQRGSLPGTTALTTVRKRWPLLAAGAAGVALVGIAAAVVLTSSSPFSTPSSAESVEPVRAKTRPADNAAATVYLDEAERFGAQGRFKPAFEMLTKARESRPDDPAIAVRLARLTDDFERQALLLKARTQLANEQHAAAIDTAKLVLDIDPNNAEAREILASVSQTRALAARSSGAHVERPQREGKLSISSEPPGLIYLDDAPIGEAPLHARAVPAGPHVVQVRLQGHLPAEVHVTVAPGKELSLLIPLAPAPPSRQRTAADLGLVETTQGETPPEEATSVEATPPVSTSAPPPGEAAKTAAVVAPIPTPTPTPLSQPVPAPTAPAEARRRKIVPPSLPKTYTAADGADVARVLGVVQNEAVVKGAVPADFAQATVQRLTDQLRRAGTGLELYPSATYYFIIRERALGHDPSTAAENLRAAYAEGNIVTFRDLPQRNVSLR